jgi:26 proteasome complex subunit DSS1
MSEQKKELKETQILKSTNDDDDEFEEFPVHESELGGNMDNKVDVNVWEDNWDDETTETDFSKQLRLTYIRC